MGRYVDQREQPELTASCAVSLRTCRAETAIRWRWGRASTRGFASDSTRRRRSQGFRREVVTARGRASLLGRHNKEQWTWYDHI